MAELDTQLTKEIRLYATRLNLLHGVPFDQAMLTIWQQYQTQNDRGEKPVVRNIATEMARCRSYEPLRSGSIILKIVS